MEVTYVVCTQCSKRFCVGIEYLQDRSLLCHCPFCATEFRFAEADPARDTEPLAWRA